MNFLQVAPLIQNSFLRPYKLGLYFSKHMLMTHTLYTAFDILCTQQSTNFKNLEIHKLIIELQKLFLLYSIQC